MDSKFRNIPTTHTRRNFLVAVVVVILATSCVWYALASHKKSAPPKTVQTLSAEIQAKVEAEVDLSGDANPVIAQVTDTGKLQRYPFFKDAQNGDWLLAYNKAGKVVLYRPSTGKVIALVNLNEQNPQPTPTPTPVVATSSLPSLAIYNGTQIQGLAAKTESELKANNIQFVGAIKTNTKKSYNQTIVIDISGKFPEVISAIASVLHATVTKIPAGEILPQADILIIAGK